ncbi:hypothetical protein [Nocardioides nanhaiensis]|uniref:CARDB domain-containing protein n=1 Tax=Nocardioides nanhaiensis TaxID=1476871 RepID=A0ABP8W5Z9_9ACTN
MRGILGAVTVCALALTVGAVPAAEADDATTSTTSAADAAGWATRLDRPGTEESGTRISAVGGVTYAAATTGQGRDRDVVVARLDAAGRVQWTREGGTARGDVVTDVVARPDGVLVLSDTVGADPEGYDGYTVTRYDAAGEHLWTRTRSHDGFMVGLAVLDDSYYVVGQRGGAPVVVRLALTDGEQLARSAAPGPIGVTSWQSVAVLRDDVVVLGAAASAAGGSDGRRMGLSRLDGRALTRDWSVAVDTAADDYPARVRVRDGRVLVAGLSIVGGDPNSQEYAMAVGAYSSDGTRQWLRRFGSGAVDGYVDLAATPRGPVVFATATTLFGDLVGMTLYPFGQDGTPRERVAVGGEYPRATGGSVEWDDVAGLLVAGTDLDDTFGPSVGDAEAFVVQAQPAGAPAVRRGVRVTLAPARAVVRPGDVRAVRARLVNAGSAATRLRVQGCTPGRGVVVRAYAGGREVTGAVRRGTWRTGSLAPGEATALTLRITARAGTKPVRVPCRVTVRDDAAPTAPRATASDAVQILVRAARRR